MRPPNHLNKAYDILYTTGGQLDRERIKAILDNYNALEYPGDYETEIRAISYDGSLRLGAWVNCDPGTGEFAWLYIAAGDEVNRHYIAMAASQESEA